MTRPAFLARLKPRQTVIDAALIAAIWVAGWAACYGLLMGITGLVR